MPRVSSYSTAKAPTSAAPKTPTPTETAPRGGGFPQAPAQPETKLQRFTREQVASVESTEVKLSWEVILMVTGIKGNEGFRFISLYI